MELNDSVETQLYQRPDLTMFKYYLSFASIASRPGAVKHGFVSKIAGGCSSYDVIAP